MGLTRNLIKHWKRSWTNDCYNSSLEKVSSKITISYLIKGGISKQLLVENWKISFNSLQKHKVFRESINKLIELKI